MSLIDSYSGNSLADRYITQRAASPIVSSAAVYQIARELISNCCRGHDACPRENNTQLPTRVLDLSSTHSNIALLYETKGIQGRYAALSYCWGKAKQQIMTTRKTLESGDLQIKIQHLPKTLQNAISVTGELGIKYLWIDSLCIIQNDNDDKAREIFQMPAIYKSAIVTTSAAIADECNKGFLDDRKEIAMRVEYSFRLPLIRDITADNPARSDIFLCTDSNFGYTIKDFENEPIDYRAWTFQEAWLSPRLLIYGSGQVQWRCLSKKLTYGLPERIHKFDYKEHAMAPEYQGESSSSGSHLRKARA